MDITHQTTKGMAAGVATSSAKVGFDIATNATPNVSHLARDVVGLALKGGIYLYNTSGLDKKLAQCMAEYQDAKYLETSSAASEPKSKIWKTTPAFREAKFLLKIYKDIEQYIEDQAINDAELERLQWQATVTVYENKPLPNIIGRLSQCCISAGVRDVTRTDMEQRFNVVSFARIGHVALSNAFSMEGERRQRRQQAGLPQDHHVVPILGRLLSLMPLCGISEISLSDISMIVAPTIEYVALSLIAIILGKAAMFETVARSRIASLRKQHATQVMNSLLFGGSTQSTAKGFAQLASAFKGERLVVGHIDASRKGKFENNELAKTCQFSGYVDAKHAVGTPVCMLDGWANLIAQRETLEKERSGGFHLRAPSTATDVHGNKFIYPGLPGKITFTVKELPNGTLMAKPRKFGAHDYLCSANYSKGSGTSFATGQEKHFGGMVGPVNCGCSPDENKAKLTKEGKYGEGLKIANRTFVANSIEHTKQLGREKVSILWCSGDWAMGVFYMQTLPQSSYLQGRGECLHCAVENAALAGCAEVIACGGGRVSAEARAIPPAKSEGIQTAKSEVSDTAAKVPDPPKGPVVSVTDSVSAEARAITPAKSEVSDTAAKVPDPPKGPVVSVADSTQALAA
jgi:hypothetical protein